MMTEPSADPNQERRSLVEAFDWRAGRTWALFAGASVGFGGVLALVCVALEGFVYLLFATEPPEGRAFVTLCWAPALPLGRRPFWSDTGSRRQEQQHLTQISDHTEIDTTGQKIRWTRFYISFGLLLP